MFLFRIILNLRITQLFNQKGTEISYYLGYEEHLIGEVEELKSFICLLVNNFVYFKIFHLSFIFEFSLIFLKLAKITSDF